MHNLLPSAQREVRLELGAAEAKLELRPAGRQVEMGPKCLAQSRRVDLMAARLQSSCRLRASVAAGGGDAWGSARQSAVLRSARN